MAVRLHRAEGTPDPVEVDAQVSETGLYLEPVLNLVPEIQNSASFPPHTIISVPVQTALWELRADGTPAPVEVGSHELVVGLYRPPVLLA